MLGRTLDILRQHRLAQSAAVIVGLILVTAAHAPVWPVVAGCLLAMGFIILRGLLRDSRTRSAKARR